MAAQKSIDRQKPAILFVHNTLMWYTKPFFVRLSEICNVKFIFTHMQLGKRIYGVETLEENEGFEGVKYKVLKRYFNNISPSGIPLGLIKDLYQGRYDIVVASLGSIEMLLCFLAAKLRGKPIILFSEVWGWNRKGASLREKIFTPLTKFIVSHADAFLVPGTIHKEYCVSLGASPEKVFIMPNVSNLTIKEEDYENKEKLKKKLNVETKRAVLYVGRLVKQKGVEYLVKAFAKLKRGRDDIVLVIVGGGESRNGLELLSKNLNIENSVYLIGFVENINVAPYYLLSDVCVVPSINYGQADCWGYVVNEAMCCGKPVIATDAVGAAFSLIRNGENGFIVPEKDVNALYVALKKIIFDSDLQMKMGMKSKKIIEEGFRYKNMVDGFRKAVEYVWMKT